jgi:hypothetical protein
VLLLVFGVTTHAQSNVYTNWTAQYRPGELPVAIVGDGQGNTYVTGSVVVCFQSSTNGCQTSGTESVTVKYDSHGQTVWRAFLAASPATNPNWGGAKGGGLSIALDAQGNVYVLSVLFLPNIEPNVPTVATAKYSANGVRQWVNYIASTYNFDSALIPTATSIDAYYPTAMAVTPGGDVYSSFYHSSIHTPNDISANVVKYDTTGKRQWIKTVSPTPYNFNTPEAMQLDANENFYVLVDSLDTSSASTPQHHVSDIFKFNSNGNLLTSFGADKLGNITGATAPAGNIGPYSVPSVFPFHVDAQGNSYVGGGGSPNANGVQPRIVAKFKTDGTVDWLYTFGPPNNRDNSNAGISNLAVDHTGNVFVAQILNANGGSAASNGTDIIVNKFDSTGQLLWTTQYNGHADGTGFDEAVGIAVDSAGSSYVTGISTGPQTVVGTFTAIATIKYDTKGNRVWVERYQPNPQIPDGPPTALAVSGSDVFVTGLGGYIAPPSQFPSQQWLTINYGQDAFEANPAVLNFGGQTVNAHSAPQTVTLTNITAAPFIIKTINYTGDIHFTNDCPDTLNPGNSCHLFVTFTPTTLGKRAGTIIIRDTSPGNAISPETIQVTGTGTP